MTVQVSVVVPTYKRSEYLERCLNALLAQDFPPDAYEVIIVDAAASEGTKKQVEAWKRDFEGQGYRVCYLAVSDPQARQGPAAARNSGWRAAKGEIIAFTDDDCIPELSWLKAGVRAFRDGMAAVSGRVLMPLPLIPTDYQYNAAQRVRREFGTANCFYRRDLLSEIGGFDERFTASWCGDSDLFFRLMEKNVQHTAVPEAIVLHPVRTVRWGISLAQQQKNMFNALLYKKHPLLYRRKIQARPPWHYYSIVGTLLIAVLGLAMQLWLLAVIALSLWLFMTMRFCLKRLQKTTHRAMHVLEMVVTSALIPPLAIFWRLYGMCKFRVPFL